MILVLTRIKPSPIHGLGLFAAEFIRKGTVVWEYNDPPDFRIPVSSPLLKEEPWKTHRKYGYQEVNRPYVEFPGDQAMFINHSVSRANTKNFDDKMVATRDIAVDEELLANYHEFESEPTELKGLKE
jgi:SET domain-containing protein